MRSSSSGAPAEGASGPPARPRSSVSSDPGVHVPVEVVRAMQRELAAQALLLAPCDQLAMFRSRPKYLCQESANAQEAGEDLSYRRYDTSSFRSGSQVTVQTKSCELPVRRNKLEESFSCA